MEPVTHILTGACLARTGLNRRAAYTTLTMALAAEMPDIDVMWGWVRGPVAGFAHHRGITHTFVGLPVEAAIMVGAVWALHRVRLARAHGSEKPLTKAPVHWGWLYVFALLALLSHLLLDYTNNYGLRPFFPFNPHWYAGSFVFIFDPWIFLLLVAALVLPSIFALVSSEVGARKRPFRGRGWAVFALVTIALLWAVRWEEHGRAVAMAESLTMQVEAEPGAVADAQNADALAPETPAQYLNAQKVVVSPDPFSPFRWYAGVDFGPAYGLADINTRVGSVLVDDRRLVKAARTAEVLAAERSALGRAYLDWSMMPVITEGKLAEKDDDGGVTAVMFQDVRFLGGPAILERRAPLTGTVELDEQGRVVVEEMDGKR